MMFVLWTSLEQRQTKVHVRQKACVELRQQVLSVWAHADHEPCRVRVACNAGRLDCTLTVRASGFLHGLTPVLDIHRRVARWWDAGLQNAAENAYGLQSPVQAPHVFDFIMFCASFARERELHDWWRTAGVRLLVVAMCKMSKRFERHVLHWHTTHGALPLLVLQGRKGK